MKEYDIIIAGGGCAGLSLLMRLLRSGRFGDKKILLVDREPKTANDRTWCFWESQPGFFEPIVYRSWSQLHFYGKNFTRLLNIEPYRYKMIRGIDFYQYCHETIRQHGNVDLIEGNIDSLTSEDTRATLSVNNRAFIAPLLFNSIPKKIPDSNRYYSLKQHFKGWTIETDGAVFNPGEATLMDFRTSQQHGTTFVYILPFSSNEALVEYTLFSKGLLAPQAYDAALRDYIGTYLSRAFSVTSEEFGIIPMTNFRFPAREGRIFNIGTAGGYTKASTGYTFQFIQKNTQQIVSSLIERGTPTIPAQSGKFLFYDSTLLSILQARKMEGIDLFTELFKNGDPQTVFRFLDNETTIGEDLNIMKRLPAGVFSKAALRNMLNLKA